MMMIYENIRLALFSLKANKMRALLTMLGIIIGIGSVIAIMTVGDSVTSTVADSMSSLGANNITVTLEERKDDEEASDAMFGMNWGSSKDENAKQPTQKDYITTDMLRQMKEAFGDSITAYSITEQVGSGSIQQNAESGKANVSVMGTSLGYFLANDVQLVQGSYFSEEELENGAMVALISEEALDDLFHGDADAAVGSTMTVSVNDKYYNLIIEGVYAKDEDETMSMYSMFMNSDATNLYIPLKTAQDINHASGYQTLTVVVDPNQNPDQLAADIESYFDNLYRNNRDFIVSATSMASMVSIMETMMSTNHNGDCFDWWYCSCRGRYRGHEYHAGIHYGANEGNWYPKSTRRTELLHPPAVYHRVHCDLPDRGRDRYCSRLRWRYCSR